MSRRPPASLAGVAIVVPLLAFLGLIVINQAAAMTFAWSLTITAIVIGIPAAVAVAASRLSGRSVRKSSWLLAGLAVAVLYWLYLLALLFRPWIAGTNVITQAFAIEAFALVAVPVCLIVLIYWLWEPRKREEA